MEIGKFFSTPLYPLGNDRFQTEVVGLEVSLRDDACVELRLPQSPSRVLTRNDPGPMPLELVYEERFEEALGAYRQLLSQNPRSLSDGMLSEIAMLTFWDLMGDKGRGEAKRFAREILQIGIELFPGDAPMCEYSMQFYR